MKKEELIKELIEDDVTVKCATFDNQEWVSFFDLALSVESRCKVERETHIRNSVSVAYFYYPELERGHALVRDNKFGQTELYLIKRKEE